VLIVRAAKKSASVPAPDSAESEILKVDLSDLQAGNVALNVRLHDGDTINVPKALSVFVTGEVKSPGAYAVEPGTTVLQVLSLAGGITDRGSSSRVRILKTVNGKQTDAAAKMTDTISPGDTIVVKPRFF
jgi:polysaccharide export outer membrane protein